MASEQQRISIPGVTSAEQAKEFVKNCVGGLNLGTNVEDCAILRASLYALIDEGLVAIPAYNGLTVYCGYVNLNAFMERLTRRCSFDVQAGSGYDKFNRNPATLLSCLQLLGYVNLTEDLINMTSLSSLKLEAIMPGPQSSAPPVFGAAKSPPNGNLMAGEFEEEFSYDEDSENDEEGDGNGYYTYEEDYPDVFDDVETSPSGSHDFYFRTPGLSKEKDVKKAVQNAIGSRLRGSGHKKVGIAAVMKAFEMGFSRVSDGGWVQRPVVLTAVYQALPQQRTKKGNRLREASRTYEGFKNSLRDAHLRRLIKLFKEGGHEKILVVIQNLLTKACQRAPVPKNKTKTTAQTKAQNGVVAAAIDQVINGHRPQPLPPAQLPSYQANFTVPRPAVVPLASALHTHAGVHQNGNGLPIPPPPSAPAPQSAPAPAGAPPPSAEGEGPPKASISVSIVDSVHKAQQAVAVLMQHGNLGLVCIPSDPKYASAGNTTITILAAAISTGQVFLFDFQTMGSRNASHVWELLKPIFQSPDIYKYIHNGCWAGPAILRQAGARVKPLWDVQVAYSVVEVLKGIGGEYGRIGTKQELSTIFAAYKVPPNPELHRRPDTNISTLRRRPLSNPLIKYLSHDAFHLIELSDHLWDALGPEGSNTVRRLSRAYSESLLPENQRSYLPGTGPTHDTKNLPHGVPLQVHFDVKNGYKASYGVAPGNMHNITGGVSPGDAGVNRNRDGGEELEVDVGNEKEEENSVLNPAAADKDPALNPDVKTVLSLFPEEVANAVLALCRGGAEAQPPEPDPAQGGPQLQPSEEEGELMNEDTEEEEEEEQEERHLELKVVEDKTGRAQSIFANSAEGNGGTSTGQARNGVVEGTVNGRNGAPGTAGEVKIKWPIEIVVDAGRPISVRFADGTESEVEGCHMSIGDALKLLTESRIRLGLDPGYDREGGPGADIFCSDNRAGIPGTLHRISAIRGRRREVLGLTYRIGRHLKGVGALIHDVLAQLSSTQPAQAAAAAAMSQASFSLDGNTTNSILSSKGGDPPPTSLLLLGPPGTGKSTLLRDVARILANTFQKRVVVVDTSNEIAGEGGIPHACIGKARRMMVPHRDCQHEVMKEAVQNHNPDVVIIDEIGDVREVSAAKTIAQRGVVLVGTAHGTSLETLLKNPELNSLVGGLQPVILGDAAARSTNAGSKTRLERKGAPTFSTVVELLGPSKWRIHWNVAKSVDSLLAGKKPETQLRWVAPDGRYLAQLEGGTPHAADLGGLKAAQIAMKAVAAQAGVGGGESSGWIADLALLASRY